MPVEVKADKDNRWIVLVYSGAVTAAQLQAAVTEAAGLARQTGTRRFLADCRGLTGGHSVLDLMGVVAMFESCGVDHTMREAVVMPPGRATRQEAEFYETACLNRGYVVRLFDDLQGATEWLEACRVRPAGRGEAATGEGQP